MDGWDELSGMTDCIVAWNCGEGELEVGEVWYGEMVWWDLREWGGWLWWREWRWRGLLKGDWWIDWDLRDVWLDVRWWWRDGREGLFVGLCEEMREGECGWMWWFEMMEVEMWIDLDGGGLRDWEWDKRGEGIEVWSWHWGVWCIWRWMMMMEKGKETRKREEVMMNVVWLRIEWWWWRRDCGRLMDDEWGELDEWWWFGRG